MTMLRPMLLVAGLLLPLFAAAQTPGASTPAPAKPPEGSAAAAAQLRPGSVPLAATEESRREARALGELLQFPARARNNVAQMRTQAVQWVVQRSGKPAPQASQAVDEILMPDLKDMEARIAALLVENLASAFTATDLAQMRTFFGTPVGKCWLQYMPAVERDNLRQIQMLGQQSFREAISRHADALHAQGVNF
jgi:hypothetical protein